MCGTAAQAVEQCVWMTGTACHANFSRLAASRGRLSLVLLISLLVQTGSTQKAACQATKQARFGTLRVRLEFCTGLVVQPVPFGAPLPLGTIRHRVSAETPLFPAAGCTFCTSQPVPADPNSQPQQLDKAEKRRCSSPRTLLATAPSRSCSTQLAAARKGAACMGARR